MENWHKTSEELPLEGEVVIGRCNDGFMVTVSINKYKTSFEECGTGTEIFFFDYMTHWCRIPKFE